MTEGAVVVVVVKIYQPTLYRAYRPLYINTLIGKSCIAPLRCRATEICVPAKGLTLLLILLLHYYICLTAFFPGHPG